MSGRTKPLLCFLTSAFVATSCTSLPPDLEQAQFREAGGPSSVSFAEGRVFLALRAPFTIPGWRQFSGYDFKVDGDDLLLALTSVEAIDAIGDWAFRFTSARDRLIVHDRRTGSSRELVRRSAVWPNPPDASR